MDDSTLVDILHCHKQLVDNTSCLFFRKSLSVKHIVKELASFNQFQDHVGYVFRFIQLN